MSEDKPVVYQDEGWRTRAMLAGGIIGSLIGVSAAYLYVRASDEGSEGRAPKRLKTGDAVRVGVALTALVRQIAELGTRK